VDSGSNAVRLVQPRVVFIGDSITVGIGDELSLGGFRGRIQTWMMNDTRKYLPGPMFFGSTSGAANSFAWYHAFSGESLNDFYSS
jgi:hypothetical protein